LFTLLETSGKQSVDEFRKEIFNVPTPELLGQEHVDLSHTEPIEKDGDWYYLFENNEK